MIDRRNVLVHRSRRSKKPLPQSQIFPLLKLPLEIRIVIYEYILAHGVPKVLRSRLPSIMYTNLQIAREVYQYCTFVAIVDIKFPNISQTRWSQVPGYWLIPYALFKAPRVIALLIIKRLMKNALHEARRFAAHKERKGLTTYLRTKCFYCDGLDIWRRSRRCWTCRNIVELEGWQEMWKRYGTLLEHC